MKRITPIVISVLCLLFATSLSAQMDKKELKEWKKRLKSLSPEEYKTLLEDNRSLKGQTLELSNEVKEKATIIEERDTQIIEYQNQVRSLRLKLSKATAAATANAASNKSDSSERNNSDYDKGIVFKVQLGAFSFLNIGNLANQEVFGAEKENGLFKYTLGIFREYRMADSLKKHLRNMGVKDAWVVSFKDGRRVPFNEVISTIRNQKL